MYYRHNMHYDYPERSDQHMIEVKHIYDTNFDENYKYLDKSGFYKFKRGVLWVLLYILVFPLCFFLHGLRIEGRKNLKENKKLLKNGAITIANHVMW